MKFSTLSPFPLPRKDHHCEFPSELFRHAIPKRLILSLVLYRKRNAATPVSIGWMASHSHHSHWWTNMSSWVRLYHCSLLGTGRLCELATQLSDRLFWLGLN